jgi:hypothetical protein
VLFAHYSSIDYMAIAVRRGESTKESVIKYLETTLGFFYVRPSCI